MSGARIAAKVQRGLAKVGSKTGNGPMICTLRRPSADGPTDPWGGGGSGPTYHEVTAVQTQKHIRDASGTLVGETKTVLLVDATGVSPLKSDYVAVNLRIADVTSGTRFHEIADVETVAPAGVALMHKVTLAD